MTNLIRGEASPSPEGSQPAEAAEVDPEDPMELGF